jgi:hypothetical protein
VLENELAVLPPTDEDFARYRAMLANRDRNLVAVINDRVVGTVTYDFTDGGVGDIGVFVAVIGAAHHMARSVRPLF